MEAYSRAPQASFIDLMMDAVFAVDTEANIVYASASCERILGYTPQEVIGKNMFDFMLPADREVTRQSVSEVMSGIPQVHFENRYVHKNGQVVHIMWATRWSEATQLRVGVARDITERKRSESRKAALYAISEAAYDAEDLVKLFQHIHQIVGTLLLVDDFSVILYNSETGQMTSAYPQDAQQASSEPYKPAAGSLLSDIIHSGQPRLLGPEETALYRDELTDTDGVAPLYWLAVPLRSHNGIIGVLVVKSAPGGVAYRQEDRELLQFVSTQIATVIERQQMQDRLQYMAQYDQLTGLHNRGFLHERLKTLLSQAQREQGQFALLYLDLDKFKQVNDTFGHSVGDLLLQEVARRLKRSLNASDTLARVGGDEFVMLIQGSALPRRVEQVLENIHNAFSVPFALDGHTMVMVPSIGSAYYPEHGSHEQQLLDRADKAMYLIKKGKHS